MKMKMKLKLMFRVFFIQGLLICIQVHQKHVTYLSPPIMSLICSLLILSCLLVFARGVPHIVSLLTPKID